jgi:hypothetical protein
LPPTSPAPSPSLVAVRGWRHAESYTLVSIELSNRHSVPLWVMASSTPIKIVSGVILAASFLCGGAVVYRNADEADQRECAAFVKDFHTRHGGTISDQQGRFSVQPDFAEKCRRCVAYQRRHPGKSSFR